MQMVQERSPPAAKRVRDYLSFSAVSTFQQCPLRYAFRYILGLPEDTIASSLVVGAAIHRACERHFMQLLVGGPPLSLDALLEVFWDCWLEYDQRQILFGKSENIDSIGQLAERMLRVFRESDFADPHGNVIGVEEELRGELIPGFPDLLARVDLIVETEDSIKISDLKTSRSQWSEEHVVEASSQLLLYSELVKPLAGGKPLRLEFAVLTKTKTPELMIHAVPAELRQIERTKKIVERVWRAIESGIYYPVPSPLNCPTCPFRAPCRAWTG